MMVQFTPTEVDVETAQIGNLQMEIDLGEDGSNDAQGQGTRVSDTWIYDLDVDSSHWGTWAEFDVTGQAMAFLGLFEDAEFFEASIPYTVDVALTLDLGTPVDISIPQRPDFYSDLDPTTRSDNWDDAFEGKLTFTRPVYNQSALMQLVQPKIMMEEEERSFFSALGEVFAEFTGASMVFGVVALLVALGVGYTLRQSREDKPLLLVIDNAIDADLED